MNRFFHLLIATSVLVSVLGGPALAVPIQESDILHKTIFFDKTYGSTSGGQFDVTLNNNSTDYLFSTFCLERNECMNLTKGFKVAGINDFAIKSVSSPRGLSFEHDPLSEETKWLYWHFATGKLDEVIGNNPSNPYKKYSGSTFSFSYKNKKSSNALQNAIWSLEDELNTKNKWARALIWDAEQALGGGSFTEGIVKAINLEWTTNRYDRFGNLDIYAQDQLVAIAPAAEPATLVLLGSGMAGSLFLYRKKNR